MNIRFKRALAGVAALGVAILGAPIFDASPAHAAGTDTGDATIRTAGGAASLQEGGSNTTFTLRLPSGAACEGDGVAGHRWHTYFVPTSVDETLLQFGPTGPTGAGNKALYDVGGNPVVQKSPATGSGVIENIPDMNFNVWVPGDIAPGVYDVGIACTLGGPSATQMKRFWNVQMTVTSDAGDPGAADIHWENGTVPAAPTATTLTPGDGTLQVAFTQPSGSNPAISGFTATATGAGGPFTASGAASPLTISGLTNLSSYSVTVQATNDVGDSAASNALSGTPGKAAVTVLTAAGDVDEVDLSWTGGTGPFTIDRCTAPDTVAPNGQCDTGDTGFATSSSADNSETITGLTPGTLYTFTVYYAESFKASASATPISSAVLIQDVSVTRPNGALVLTQVCGRYGALPSENASIGFPGGFPAEAASYGAGAPSGGTAPKVGASAPPSTATATDDGEFGEYPYPDDPNYVTHCSLDLGVARLVTQNGSGLSGAGQFFSASGQLNQVTVVDTRDTDTVWTVNFVMSEFSDVTDTKHFSGNQLGWTNVSTDTAGFPDGDGTTYDQDVADDPAVAPNTSGGAGAGTSHPVAHCAAAGSCLGIATIDARIKLLIPIHALNGDYTGQLTITAA